MDFSNEIRLPIRRRRRHSPPFKAQVLQESLQLGSSLAAVAQRHNLNANLIRKWRRSGGGGLRSGTPLTQSPPLLVQFESSRPAT